MVEDYGLNRLVREPVILSPSTSGIEAMENSRALNGTEVETSGSLGSMHLVGKGFKNQTVGF